MTKVLWPVESEFEHVPTCFTSRSKWTEFNSSFAFRRKGSYKFWLLIVLLVSERKSSVMSLYNSIPIIVKTMF